MGNFEFSAGKMVRSGAAVLALGGLGVLATGCGTSAATIAKMPAAERFSNDYAQNSSDTDGCLFGTVYDPYAIYQRSAESTVTEHSGIISITPNNNGVVLHFKNDGGNEPLQPVDHATREVMASYGCDTAQYPSQQQQ